MINYPLSEGLNFARDLLTHPCFMCDNESPRFCIYRGRKCANMAVRYRGVYPSHDAAIAALPSSKPRGFDHKKVVDHFQKKLSFFNPGDYPALLRLQQILRPGSTIFDLGGGYGQCYYAYKDYIQFPDGLRWVVCDFPSFTQRGEEFAKEQLADALSFTTNRQDANGSLVYLTNGTLQYIETGLAEMLSELAEKPPHVLVNRVPVYSGETYYTVQYGAFSYSPYKVMNAEQLINSMEHLGYRKIDQWSLPRKLRIPFRSAHFVADYQGFYFALSRALPL